MTRVHAFTDDALGDLDAVGVARAIANGEISAREAAQAALARIDAVDPQLHAIVHDDRERALERADRLPVGVFRGVPSVIKNNTEFAGLPTRHGSAATADRPAKSNEAFTDQFLATGVNIVGTSSLPAFGFTATTEFSDRDATSNPWHLEYSSGASSGGSAALVAAGAVPIGHGNDGGGSIRIPAAACGLVGLKPTRGRVAQAKEARVLPIDIISNGIMSRSVRDSAWFLADIDRTFPTKKLPPVGLVEGPSARRLRIGLVTDTITEAPLDADSLAAMESITTLLTGLGHDVVPMEIPIEESFIEDFTLYWSFLAWAISAMPLVSMGPGFDASRLDPFTTGLAGNYKSVRRGTVGAVRRLKAVQTQYRAVFQQYDLVLSPTLGHATPKLGHLSPTLPFEEKFRRLKDYVAFTPLNNVSGGPGISLPLAENSFGLPLGVHFSADFGDERTLLEIAYELEAAHPFALMSEVAEAR